MKYSNDLNDLKFVAGTCTTILVKNNKGHLPAVPRANEMTTNIFKNSMKEDNVKDEFCKNI